MTKFEINFNNETNDKKLLELGCIQSKDEEDCGYMYLNLNTFEDLEVFLNKLNSSYDIPMYYSAIMSFDDPCIYLDDKC